MDVGYLVILDQELLNIIIMYPNKQIILNHTYVSKNIKFLNRTLL